jgi:hypothetical protein
VCVFTVNKNLLALQCESEFQKRSATVSGIMCHAANWYFISCIISPHTCLTDLNSKLRFATGSFET